MALRPYDAKFVPVPFGLGNTGVICHFNTLLQNLISCPVLLNTVIANKEYMSRTATGKAFYSFVSAMVTAEGAKATLDQGIESQSAKVYDAFVADLRVRRPWFKFGSSQECANEGLVLLLDMIEPPETDAKTDEGKPKKANPITQLFLHKYRCELYCKQCKTRIERKSGESGGTDIGVQFPMGLIDRMRKKPDSVTTFSETIRNSIEEIKDYLCEVCAKKVSALRRYNLTMIPEIVVCLFNIYKGPRPPRYLPEILCFPAIDGKRHIFRQVSSAEQFGDMNGGHYVARGVRAGGKILGFNDAVPPRPSTFSTNVGNENKYLVVYNFERTVESSDDKKESMETSVTKKPVSGPAIDYDAIIKDLTNISVSEPGAAPVPS